MNRLASYLIDAAQRRPDAVAVSDIGGPVHSYAVLLERVRRLATGLTSSLGLQAGDRVALAMSNDVGYPEILFAAWYAGLIVAPMNPRLHPREYRDLAADCTAGVCFATSDLYAGIAEIWPSDCPLIDIHGPDYARLVAYDEMEQPVDVPDDDTAWLFYTSGTTGRSKGAMLSPRNLKAMVDALILDSGAVRDETIVHIAPLSHGGGLFGLAYVASGLPQLILPTGNLTPATFAAALKMADKASFFAVPTLVRRMLDPDFMARSLIPHIHKIIFGGAPMYMSDLKDALNVFGAERMWGAYGQGEAPCTVTHLSSDTLAQALASNDEAVLASVGYPRTGVAVRVVDESDRTVPPDVVGEVVVAGDIVMKGYWNMPEASAATLAGGWLHTGDLGHMDKNGLLTLVDRSKDMIIAGGSNIYPREIEEVLLQHPSVREAAVVGMADKEWGEVPIAFIVSSDELGQESLESFCLERIGRYKRPRRYIFKKELPKSSYGKILKSALREELLMASEIEE